MIRSLPSASVARPLRSARLGAGLLVAGLALASGPALAGPPLPTGGASASSEQEPRVLGGETTARPGAAARLEATIVVPPGYHVYRDMVSVEVVDPGGLALGTASLPPGLEQPDPASPGSLREQYDFDAIIELPVAKAPTAGRYAALLSVRYQACKASLCLFPRTEEVTSTLVVAAP